MMSPQFIICTNSPGELTAWVTPLLQQFKSVYPNGSSHIYLTPCQYASGHEYAIAKTLCDTVYTPRDTVRTCLRLRRRKQHPNTHVLCAGGDPVYARLLARYYRCPVSIYTCRPAHEFPKFTHCFSYPKADPLMAESTRDYPVYTGLPAPYIVLMCGSRPQHFHGFVPFMSDVMRQIKAAHPELSIILAVSPFISPDLCKTVCEANDLSHMQVIHPASHDSRHILSIMAQATLIVTIPGTNTAQSAYLGVPAIVILPTNWPKKLIVDGLPGLLGRLPGIGQLVLKAVVHVHMRRKRLYALPNIWLNQLVYPEYAGHVTVSHISAFIQNVYTDTTRLAMIKQTVKTLNPAPVSRNIIKQLFG